MSVLNVVLRSRFYCTPFYNDGRIVHTVEWKRHVAKMHTHCKAPKEHCASGKGVASRQKQKQKTNWVPAFLFQLFFSLLEHQLLSTLPVSIRKKPQLLANQKTVLQRCSATQALDKCMFPFSTLLRQAVSKLTSFVFNAAVRDGLRMQRVLRL